MKRFKNKYEEELARQTEERTRQEEARKQADQQAKERRASHAKLQSDLGIGKTLVGAATTRGLSVDEQAKLSKATWKRELDDKFPVTGNTPYELVFDNALERMIDLSTADNAKYKQLLDWAGKSVEDGFSIEKISSSVEGTLAQWEKDQSWTMPAPLRTAPQRKG